MSSPHYSLRHSLLDSLLKAKRPDVPGWVVVRNTLAVSLPLVIGWYSGHPLAGLGIAAGASDIMFSDRPGPYRERLTLLLLASCAAFLAALLGSLIGAALLPMLATTLAMGFMAGMLVVFGADIARLGMTSIILLVVTAATPASLAHALSTASLIFGGGLLLTLLSIASWPLQRYRPERQALALIYRELAALARQDRENSSIEQTLADDLNQVQQTLFGRHHDRGRAMEAFGILLELAERMRLELTAIEQLHPTPATDAEFRQLAASVMLAIAEALEAGDPPQQAQDLLPALRLSEQTLARDRAYPPHLVTQAHALSTQLTAASHNANWAGARGELRARAAEQLLPPDLRSDDPLATLRANLHPQSTAFRHAVRYAISLALAVLLSHLLAIPHGYWLPMTLAIVLRADFAATLNFGLLRVLGTLLGLLLTTAMLHYTPQQGWMHIIFLTLCCATFRYLASAHYGIAVAALTGMVVIFMDMAGASVHASILERLLNTALGSLMALAVYMLWPTWERAQIPQTLAEMLHAHADYLQALAMTAAAGQLRDCRMQARATRSNAKAAMERLRSEPGVPYPLQRLSEALITNSNRLIRAITTLEAVLQHHRELEQEPALGDFIRHLSRTLDGLAEAIAQRVIYMPDYNLRQAQRMLLEFRDYGPHDPTHQLLMQTGGRLIDSIDTLLYAWDQAVASLPAQHLHPSMR